MEHTVETGRTFAPDEIGWIDFELRSQEDIKSGTYRYMNAADAVICTYALGDGPVQAVAVPHFDGSPLQWREMPTDFRAFHAGVEQGYGKWAAWNAGFDKAAWNYGTIDFPIMEAEHIIDVMAQAAISGLPPSLKMAARYTGATAKVDTGKDLIKLFCLPASVATPQSHPAEWAEFIEYARGDIVTMREIFWRTRQLPMSEWAEYWAMEKVNERGIGIDVDMVKHAGWLAHEDKRRSAKELVSLTGGEVSTVDEVANLTRWLLKKLPAEGREILLKREEEVDDDGVVTKPAKYHLTRKQVERLIAFNNDPTIDRVLQIRLYGGSKTPAKFLKIDSQHVDGVLYGQYVFAGAAQTGRASSKGVQIHNLARDTLKYEHDAIEAILAKCPYEELAVLGDDSPVARKLSLLIRPAFVPDSGNMFVWSDWSNIEARITPWLADYLQAAADKLDIFRAVDRDPSIPDIYTRTAAGISGLDLHQVTGTIRQRGKVVELALGFLGGVGALHSMAAGYGMHFSDDEARRVVDQWRAANPWAARFGQDLWDAMLQAREAPQELFPVGRVGFVYYPNLLGGSMLMWLPSGRLLTYRAWRWEQVAVKDDDDKPTGEYRTELTYGRGHGRMKLWKGILVENATQAVAADILRGTLVRMEDDGFHTRLHTHDEILGEIPEDQANAYAEAMRWQMRRGFDWSEGLPLMSEETIAPYYTKQKVGKVPEGDRHAS